MEEDTSSPRSKAKSLLQQNWMVLQKCSNHKKVKPEFNSAVNAVNPTHWKIYYLLCLQITYMGYTSFKEY